MKIIAVGTRGLTNLTNGREYTALNGIEPGILPSRPYVTVVDDEGKVYSCHASRFTDLNGKFLDEYRKDDYYG